MALVMQPLILRDLPRVLTHEAGTAIGEGKHDRGYGYGEL